MSTRTSYILRWVMAWLAILGLLASVYVPAMARSPQSQAELATAIDENSSVNGDSDLEIDRAVLAAAVRSTTNFAGVTDFISLDSSTGDRSNLFEGTGTRYVATTGSDTANDCTDSAAPCASMQRGIAMAGADEEVWVAGGTYTENLTIQISATVLGGYEPISWTRNTELYPTIIDGLGGPVVPGDWDETQVRYPYVLQQGGLYHMWYSALDVYGIQRIGYATSPDGVNWTKHPANPVLDVGAAGEWDSAYIEAPMVIYEGGEFKMWYSGGDGSHSQIGYATSPDGVAWTKSAANPVLEIGDQPWNNLDIVHPYVLHEGGTYKMWVVAIGDDGPSISYATSPDGLDWTWDANSPLFGRDWEAWVWRPFVLNQGSSYQMWYSAWAEQALVAYATAPDEITWTKQGSVLTGTVGAWDEGFVSDPSVLQVTGTYTMYYDNNENGIGLATSTDGITWTNPLTQPVLTRGTPTQWTDPVIQIVNDAAVVTLDGLTITGGEGFDAGGIYAQGATLTLNNCIVRDNFAHGSSDGWAGGGILSAGPLTILNSQIINNQVDSGASGVRTNGWNLLMVNSLVAGNNGDFAIHTNGPANLLNITVVNNESGVLINPPFSATLVITNSIIYSTGLAITAMDAASTQVSYSDIQGGITGTANIDADPLFADFANGDYHLQAGSPAIDSGTNTGAPDHDLELTPRPLDGDDNELAVTDMGAYEYQPPVVIYRTYLPVALR